MRTEWWPFFALRIRTPRLELRPPTDDDLDELGELLTAGVHDPARMPFNTPWTDAEQPELQRSALQFHWRTRASLTVDDWHVPFGVWQDGRLVGQQDVAAAQFRLLRTVNTGSWVGLGHQEPFGPRPPPSRTTPRPWPSPGRSGTDPTVTTCDPSATEPAASSASRSPTKSGSSAAGTTSRSTGWRPALPCSASKPRDRLGRDARHLQ
jgi:hypothetical protein